MNNFFKNKVGYTYYFNDYNAGQNPLLSTDEFAICELRAREFLQGICTASIPEEHIDDYFSCVCALAEKIHTQKPSNIKSENTDGYSVTYVENKECKAELYRTANLYLGATGVLYQGVE